MRTNQITKGIFLALIASAMWGISGTVLQFISQDQQLPADWFLSARTLGAGVILIGVALIKERGATFALFRQPRLIGWLVAYAVFGLMANLMTFYLSVQTGTAAAATILQYLSPLFIVIGSLLFKREWPLRSDLIAFIVSALGVFLAITKGDVSQLAIPMNALLWGIGSGLTAALYVVLPRAIVKAGVSPIVILGWGTLIAGVLFNSYRPVWHDAPQVTLSLVASMGTVIIVGTILPFCLLLYSAQFAPSDVISILDAAQPVVTFVLSVLFLGLQLSWVEALGAVLVVVAIYLLQRGRRAPEQLPTVEQVGR